MSDERPKARRHQTATERDVASMFARRDREAPHSAVPVAVDAADEVTGKYAGEELVAMRSRRLTPQRLALLEAKHDKLSESVSHITGRVDAIYEMSAAAEKARQHHENIEAAERAAKRAGIVPTIKAIGIALALVAAAVVGRHV